jgi:hypothetical protein
MSSDVVKPMASKTEDERRAFVLSSGLGRNVLAFDDDGVVHLLRAAIEREGSQIAFAKHYGINRTYLNMVLSGKRPLGDAITEALGLRKMYVVE